jgi:glucokinase
MISAAIGIDIGGTNISVGLVSAGGQLLALRRESTPRDIGEPATMARLLALTEETLAQARCEGHTVAGIGIGFGGPVDVAAQRIRWSHHAPGWSNIEPVRAFENRFGLATRLENDANAGGLGEALFGAGQGAACVLYLNVGTGVGGAVVIGGRLHDGAHGNAGEIGHVILQPDGPACPCGKRGCVEALCSGSAIGRRAAEAVAEGASDSSLLELPEPVTGAQVGAAAQAGDELARQVVAAAGRDLGLAIANACNVLDPDTVVVGGGVSELGDLYLRPAREAFAQFAMSTIAQVPIVPAQLGYNAGVIGAAAVALFPE